MNDKGLSAEIPSPAARTAWQERPHRLFRESTRAPLELPVKLRFDAPSESESGRTANLSCTGMFVCCRRPRPVGTRLRFELDLEGFERPAVGSAEVIWIRSPSGAASDATGMGLEFHYLDPQSRLRIEATMCAAIERLELQEEPDASTRGALSRARPPLAD